MADARWRLYRQRRDAEIPERVRELAEIEAINLPRRKGDPLGTLQWHDFRTGKVIRWTIEIGSRTDQVVMRAPGGKRSRSHGWAWVLEHLRPLLCGRKFPEKLAPFPEKT